jgi:hypothetical protein
MTEAHLMRIFSGGNFRNETLIGTVKVNKYKGYENEEAEDAIASECELRSKVCHKQA